MTRKKLAAASVVFLALSIVSGVTNLVSVALIARSYQPAIFALWSLFFVYHDLLAIFASPGLGQFAFKMTVRKQHGAIYAYIKRTWKRFFGLQLTVVTIALALQTLGHISHDSLMTLILSCIMLTLTYLDRIEPILLGMNKFSVVNSYKLTQAFPLLALVILFRGVSLFALLGGLILIKLFNMIIYSYYLKDFWREEFQSSTEMNDPARLEASGVNSVHVLQAIANQTPQLLLSFINRATLAQFYVANNIPNKFKDYYLQALTVVIDTLIKRKSKDRLLVTITILTIPTYFLGLILFFMSDFYIPFIFGEQYTDSIDYAKWLALIAVGRILCNLWDKYELNLGDSAFYIKWAQLRNLGTIVFSAGLLLTTTLEIMTIFLSAYFLLFTLYYLFRHNFAFIMSEAKVDK